SLDEIHPQPTQGDLEQRVRDREDISGAQRSQSRSIAGDQRDLDVRPSLLQQAREELGLIAESSRLDVEPQDIEAAIERATIVIAHRIAAHEVDEDGVDAGENGPVQPSAVDACEVRDDRSEEHTSELQS